MIGSRQPLGSVGNLRVILSASSGLVYLRVRNRLNASVKWRIL